jgi:hypothetical protein
MTGKRPVLYRQMALSHAPNVKPGRRLAGSEDPALLLRVEVVFACRATRTIVVKTSLGILPTL